MELVQIGHVENDYNHKFGIPRQSGLVEEVVSCIVLEGKYAVKEAVRGLEEYDYLWILWGFSENHEKDFSATVKPPRLGGKIRMGVFATRSPYRPNPIGLSSVKIKEINTEQGVRIYVTGADVLNGTPVYDMKPYLAYADAHPEARSGFTDRIEMAEVEVIFPEKLLQILPEEKREAAIALLRQDPRPGYEKHMLREYKLAYAGYDISFEASDATLTVTAVKLL